MFARDPPRNNHILYNPASDLDLRRMEKRIPRTIFSVEESCGPTPLTCWYFSYWSGVPTEGFELYVRDKRALFSFLTNDNLFAIFIPWPIDEFDSVKGDIEGQFMQAVDMIPDFADRFRSGRPEERFFGTADLLNF